MVLDVDNIQQGIDTCTMSNENSSGQDSPMRDTTRERRCKRVRGERELKGAGDENERVHRSGCQYGRQEEVEGEERGKKVEPVERAEA